MSSVSPDDPRLQGRRPLLGLLLLTLPIVMVGILIVLYGGMWWLGARGRPAEGPPVVLSVQGCPEGIDVVEARMVDMGLTPTRVDGSTFEVALPTPEAVAARIPITLGEPGKLEIVAPDGERLVGATDVLGAAPRMNLMMDPSTAVSLKAEAVERLRAHARAHPDGVVTFVVDGKEVATHYNSVPHGDDEVLIRPSTEPTADQWQHCAEWAIIVNRPLPCAVTIL